MLHQYWCRFKDTREYYPLLDILPQVKIFFLPLIIYHLDRLNIIWKKTGLCFSVYATVVHPNKSKLLIFHIKVAEKLIIYTYLLQEHKSYQQESKKTDNEKLNTESSKNVWETCNHLCSSFSRNIIASYLLCPFILNLTCIQNEILTYYTVVKFNF